MSTYWKNKIELDTYVHIQTPYGSSYGGNQRWFLADHYSVLAAYGCGLIALGDFFLAAARVFPALTPSQAQKCFCPFRRSQNQAPLVYKSYISYLHSFRKQYLTILPYIGANAWQIWWAAFCYIKKSGVPLRTHWGTFTWNLPRQMASMLEAGLPVIFCVGPNLNPFKPRQKVSLYQMQDGRMQKVGAVRAHYMNLTGLFQNRQNELYLQISSWGKRYYISWKEYQIYRKRQPPVLGSWLSNILVVHTGHTADIKNISGSS